MTASVIQCIGVTKKFGDFLAVDNVDINLDEGEILSILGPSGCGKTTLLRLIAGFEEIDDGEILVRSNVASSREKHLPPEQRHLGMVFQEYALFPHMTVAQNVIFGLQGTSSESRGKRLGEVMQLVRLGGLENRYPHELSGGQQQRVALARTLAPNPIAVLLDEPFSNLDASMRWEMRQEVEAILRANGTATVFVTHDRDEAFAMADRIGVMNEGRIEQIATPESIFSGPSSAFVAQLTGMCDLLSGVVRENKIECELGEFMYTCTSGSIPDGCNADILVRPDDFKIVPLDTGSAVIESREFRSGETMIVVRLPSGSAIRCRQVGYFSLNVGTKVSLYPANNTPFIVFEKPDAQS